MNKKAIFGNSCLVAWLVFSLWMGMELVFFYGETMQEKFPFVAFLLVWVLAIFVGRFFIEWIINKLWKSHD